MYLKPFDSRDGMKVWLSNQEVEQLISVCSDTEERLAILLGSRCGLRRSEIVDIRPRDVIDTTAGPRVRVWESKGSEYRETPAPGDVSSIASAMGDLRQESDDEPLIDRSPRWVKRRLDRLTDRLEDELSDDGWSYVTPHDLRRSWATLMAGAAQVDPLLVLEWGGWEDLETFLDHYLGVYSPEVQRRELEKVPWIDIKDDHIETLDDPTVSILTDVLEGETADIPI